MPYLYRLRRLYVNSNDIAELPKDLPRLKCLEIFDINDCLIAVLPENIVKMPKLQELNIEDNKIGSMPLCFTKLSKKVNVIGAIDQSPGKERDYDRPAETQKPTKRTSTRTSKVKAPKDDMPVSALPPTPEITEVDIPVQTWVATL